MHYKTLKEYGEHTIVIHKSKFISYASPVQNEEESLHFLQKIRNKHPDARHNVYAYKTTENRQRYSDDGEPSGTAGMPTLNAILSEELCNCIVVTTRYFGGILLGTGGLVRAYTDAARGAIESAKIITKTKSQKCRLFCSYAQYEIIQTLLASSDSTITECNFTDHVELWFIVPLEQMEETQKQIIDKTFGSVTIFKENIGYF